MVFSASLLDTQYYKVRVNLGVVAIEKGAFRSTLTKVTNITYFLFIIF